MIYLSIAPVEGAKNPAAAQKVLKYLFSDDGQCLLAAKNFLPTPLLVGGDRKAVPTELRRYFTGTYPPKSTPHHALTRPSGCKRTSSTG